MDGSGGLPGLPAAAGAAPLREESIQNAVAFLQHPKVRPSAAEYKRAFLEKKGLTAAEIAEAFRRVPEPPPGSAPPAAEYAPAPPAVVQYAPPQPPPPPPRPALSWSQLAFRAGLLAGGALAAKRTLAPLAQPYVRQLADYCGLRTAEADAAAQRERAALAAASAALDAKASAVASSLDDVKALLRRVEAQAATPPPQPPSDLSPAIRDALRDIKEDLRSELRAVADRVTAASPQQQPQPQQHTPHASPGYLTPAPAAAVAVAAPPAAAAAAAPGDDVRAELAEIKALLAAGRARDGGAPPPLPSRTVTRYAALQGEAGSPATPADAAAWASPAGANAAAASGTPGAAAASSGGRGNAAPRQQPGAPPPSPPPHSERYLAVLQAIESGQTPPGIRDIDDRAPNPSAPPPPARMAPPAKPWERAGGCSDAAAASGGNAFDGRGLPPAPWAARSGAVRITELPESGGENGGGNGNAAHRQAAPWVPQRGQGGVAEAGGWTPPKVPGASSAAAAKALGLPSAFAGDDEHAAGQPAQQQQQQQQQEADAAAAGGGG